MNACAIVVFCTLLIVFLYRGYELRGLNEQIQSWETRIAERSPQNEEVVALSRDFRAESQKVERAVSFVNSPVRSSEFLAELARTLPDRVVLSRINFRSAADGPRIALSGRILGTSQQATDIVSDYELQFYEYPYFADIVSSVNVTSLSRNPETDTLSFSFTLLLRDRN